MDASNAAIGRYNKEQYLESAEAWLIYDAPFKCARNIAKKIRGNHVLDMGAGPGVMASVIEAISDAKITKYEDNLYTTPFKDEEFETVYSSHVLEHLENPYLMVLESIRIAEKRIVHVVPQGDVDDLNIGTKHIHKFNRKTFKNLLEGMMYKVSITFIPDEHMNSLMCIIDKEIQK